MTSSKAPTGRQTTAQGKEPRDAALGPPPPQHPSPERAGHLPVGWIATGLGEICEILDSRRKPINASERSKRNEGKSGSELFPYYGATGEAGRIDSYLFDGEYVLIGEDAAPFLEPHRGVAYLVTGKFWVNNHAHILKHPTSNRFLCYYLLQANYRPFVTGTTRLKLNQEQLRKIPIPLPPLAEQKRIVSKIEELFSELDAGEESLRRARRQLGVYRQSLLKQAFESKLTAPWRKQNPHLLESSDQLVKRIQAERQARYEEELKAWEAAMKQRENAGDEDKRPSKPKRPAPPARIHLGDDDDLYDLPDGWAWLSFDSACYESVLGKMLDNAKNRGEPKPYLRNINVRWGRFDLSDLLNIRIEQSEIGRYRAEAGDLIICEGGEPGRCAVWPTNEHREVFLQKALHRVRFTDCVSPYFVQLLMSLTASTKRLEKYFTGTTIKHLTGTGLSGVPIPLCSLPEQQEIVRLLDEQFTVIEQNEREIDAALKRSAAMRQSILKKAFTGQLVPQDPTDEPASVLLERIRMERCASAAVPKKKTSRQKSSLP
jgi:type I restriction enzyme, S subunit